LKDGGSCSNRRLKYTGDGEKHGVELHQADQKKAKSESRIWWKENAVSVDEAGSTECPEEPSDSQCSTYEMDKCRTCSHTVVGAQSRASSADNKPEMEIGLDWKKYGAVLKVDRCGVQEISVTVSDVDFTFDQDEGRLMIDVHGFNIFTYDVKEKKVFLFQGITDPVVDLTGAIRSKGSSGGNCKANDPEGDCTTCPSGYRMGDGFPCVTCKTNSEGNWRPECCSENGWDCVGWGGNQPSMSSGNPCYDNYQCNPDKSDANWDGWCRAAVNHCQDNIYEPRSTSSVETRTEDSDGDWSRSYDDTTC
jgi:hypothetical protein